MRRRHGSSTNQLLNVLKLALPLALLLAMALPLSPGEAQAAGVRPWFAPQNATLPGHDSGNATQNATQGTAQNATDKPREVPQAKPDPAHAMQEKTLRDYYLYMMTLDDRMPTVFSRKVREEETLAFLSMRHLQRQRGLLGAFRAARVTLDGLVFTRITADPDLARIRVTGSYALSVAAAFEVIEESAIFVLLPEDGEWKIYERREETPPAH
jgi:hypothetical protein